MHNFSIIVPCLNEEKNIEHFSKTAESLLKEKYNFKIIFIDDGSTDNTWSIIENLKKKSSFIHGVKLSRNFGKENAICCGLNNIKDEDFIITIDSDLQHPLEKIEEMINLWENGYKIINTHRKNRTEGTLREFGSTLYYFFIRKFTDLSIISQTTDFILIDKDIVKKFNQIPESNKQFRILINWLGFKKINLPIEINSRIYEKSKYDIIRLLRLAINSFTSFSIFPIKLIGFLGLLMTTLSTIIIVTSIIDKIFFFKFINISNQSLLILIQILLTGLILSAVAFLGVYISKILNNTNNRPNYIIEKTTE
jgi:glycosyltransferase involved in cell wall biosynthesis